MRSSEIIGKGIQKEEACGSIASILSIAGNNLHFPEALGKVDDEEIFRCLSSKIGIDTMSIDIWSKGEINLDFDFHQSPPSATAEN